MHKIFEDFFDSEQLYIRAEVSAEHLKIIQPHLMPESIKSAIVFLIPYYTGKHENRNISLYAVSKDYHLYARSLYERMYKIAKEHFPDEEFYGFCDSSPINDVAAAITAGLGVLGENRLLINEKYGSFVFVGCVLTTLPAEKAVNVPVKRCLQCGKCTSSCKFLADRSGVCMSELNQRKVLTDAELEMVLSEKIRWGCDKCQEICPMNKDVSITPIQFFHEDISENISSEMIKSMSKAEFKTRAYSWRGKNTLLRNLGFKDVKTSD